MINSASSVQIEKLELINFLRDRKPCLHTFGFFGVAKQTAQVKDGLLFNSETFLVIGRHIFAYYLISKVLNLIYNNIWL